MCGKRRGQTTLDFATGVGVFLLVVSFVFPFVPSMLDPVSEGSQDDRVVADRIATQLATGMLVTTPANPYVLDMGCTDPFFDDTLSVPSRCQYAGSSLKERVGVTDRVNMRVRLTGSAFTDKAVSDPTGATPPSSSGTVFVARRGVQYDGNRATLIVEVW